MELNNLMNQIFYERICEPKPAYQTQHLAGRHLLSLALRQVYGIELAAEELEGEILVGENGKPYLKNYPDIHFNISHCKDWAACIVADVPVGIDVECIKNYRKGIERRVLTESERQYLSAFADDEERYRRQFFRFWTLKEAYLKWKGCGFAGDPGNVEFSFDAEHEDGTIRCSDPVVRCLQIKLDGDCYLAVVI